MEKILAKYLNLTYRKIEGKERSLNLKKEDDKAYVRCKFKRLLKSVNPRTILISDNKNIIEIKNISDLNSIKNLNQILKRISKICTDKKNEYKILLH